jgi:hypothetical protein
MQPERLAEPIVLVDARNAIRSRWPNLAEDWFVERTRAWAEREGVQAVIVFDGRGPGGLLGEGALDERTRLVGTGGQIADDWIAERALQLHAAGRRLWLVSSDRELRDRVAPHVERVLGGGAFAGLLEQLGGTGFDAAKTGTGGPTDEKGERHAHIDRVREGDGAGHDRRRRRARGKRPPDHDD